MVDREKVIKGLECCHNENNIWNHDLCPYHGFDSDCESRLLVDTIALLKEQEAKTGHWIISEYEYLDCSCCGNSYYTGCDSTEEAKMRLEKRSYYNYCPYCGAKMGNEVEGR